MITYKNILLCASMVCIVSSCGKAEAPRASATEVTEIALSDVPQTVNDLVQATRPDFTTTEVLKKVREGRVYYDVEGELTNGDEIEFDVLMTKDGPQIVEIQRDLEWSFVPQFAKAVIDEANSEDLEIVRIIESIQTDNSIIYEVFVANHPSDPRFEVSVKDNQARLLEARWKH